MYWLRTLMICMSVSMALLAWLGTGAARRNWSTLGLVIMVIWCVEMGALALALMGMSNGALYNLAWPLYFLLFLLMNQRISPVPRALLLLLVVVFLAVWGWNLMRIEWERELATVSVVSGAFLLTLVFFRALWRVSNDLSGRLRDSTAFWISLAVVLYYGALTPLMGMMNYLLAKSPITTSSVFWMVQFLAVLHYLLLAKACRAAQGSETSLARNGS